MSWISVNERLPTRNGYYMVTVKAPILKGVKVDNNRTIYFSNYHFKRNNEIVTSWLER